MTDVKEASPYEKAVELCDRHGLAHPKTFISPAATGDVYAMDYDWSTFEGGNLPAGKPIVVLGADAKEIRYRVVSVFTAEGIGYESRVRFEEAVNSDILTRILNGKKP